VPGTSVAQVNGPGTVCANNTAYASSLSPWTERLSAKVHADFKISDAMQAFADLWESNNTTVTNNFVGRLGNNTQTYDPATGGLNPVSNLVPGSNRITRSACRPSWSTRSRPRSRAQSSNFWRAATV
jgi:iron complex outermembrane receptor protein